MPRTPTWIYLSWLFQAAAAIVLFLVAIEKLRGSPATIEIFSRLRLEPFGRYSAAITEIVAGICILLPWLVWAGGAMGVSLALGAIFFHGALLGLDVGGDGGLHFYAAICAAIFSLIVLYLRLVSAWPGAAPGPAFMQDRVIAQGLRRLKGKRNENA